MPKRSRIPLIDGDTTFYNSFRFEKLPSVPVVIDGRSCALTINTGAEVTTLGNPLATFLGCDIVDGNVFVKQLSIGKFKFKDLRLNVCETCGNVGHGFLGWDIIQQLYWEINFIGRSIMVKTPEIRDQNVEYRKLPIITTVLQNGQELEMRLNTGQLITALHLDTDKLKGINRVVTFGGDGESDKSLYTIPDLGYDFNVEYERCHVIPNLHLSFYGFSQHISYLRAYPKLDDNVHGFIGCDMFSNSTLVIDPVNNHLEVQTSDSEPTNSEILRNNEVETKVNNQKKFNITGLCVPDEDYMVDVSNKVTKIKDLAIDILHSNGVMTMSDTSDLAIRMKGYENVQRHTLTGRMPVLIRVDGKSFHTFTKGMQRPFDMVLMNAMWEAAKYLCDKIMGAKLAYVQSDEITVLLTDYDTLQTQAWFDKNVVKMTSISASMATMAFNKAFMSKCWENEQGTLNDTEMGVANDAANELIRTYESKTGTAVFDSRVWVIPKEEVCNAFIWRQMDATRNSISMVAQSKFSHKQLFKKTTNEMQEMLWQEYQLNWNDLDTYLKRGACIIKERYEKDDMPGVMRSHWVVDKNIPIFTKDRDYIEKFVYLPESE